MSENVFILGAGASVESGTPLMNNFLDVAEDLLKADKFEDIDKPKIKQIFKVISQLHLVHSKSYLDLDNIESLFGTIEMAKTINQLGDYTPEEIENIRQSLITLIVRTIEKTTKFPYTTDGSNRYIAPPQTYNSLVNILKNFNLIEKSSIITFNYDIALDFALYRNNISINYCLDNNTSNFKLMKLHGSINWGQCEQCDFNNIIPYSLHDHLQQYDYSRIFDDTTRIHISSTMQNGIGKAHLNRYTDHHIKDLPVIVPPTWNKTEYHGTLTNVWNHAANELKSAKNIYVLGYSLPESDSFFRYLFALGTMGDERIRNFIVFNPDESGETEARYRKLLGKGIEKRFEYVPTRFSSSIDILASAIKKASQAY